MLGALLAALLLNSPAPADVPVICPEQARAYVGRDVIVRGRVDQVGISEDGKTLFLNFCGRYPGHLFNAVIFSENLPAFPEAHTWEDKTIKVRGKIKLYQDIRVSEPFRGVGKPEIILERREQVTIDSTLPEGAVPQGTEAAPGAVGSGLGGTDITPVMDYDSPPRPNKIIHPQYSTEAFLKKIEGTVMVEVLIDSQDRVARARVIQSVPPLDKVALVYVYQWTFHPAMKNGHPVPALVNAPLIFRLPKAPALQRGQRIGPAVARGAQETAVISGLEVDSKNDFTPWAKAFEMEVYANWVVPAGPKGITGHVQFEFTVETNGTISSLRTLKSTGSALLDEAAQTALTKSRFPAPPAYFGPSPVTMRVAFFYLEQRF